MFYRKEKLTYNIAIPPLKKPFSQMTDIEAQEYFDWFIDVIPERMEYMRGVCAKDLGIDKSKLDFSPESLITIWKWFLTVAKVEETPKARIEEIKKQYEKSPLAEFMLDASKAQLSLQTEYILNDIAMYFGEVFIRNNSSLCWDVCKKKNIDYNKPVISGFKDGNFILILEPRGAVSGAAIDIYTNRQDNEDIYRVYAHWITITPNHAPLNYVPTEKERIKQKSVVEVNGEYIPIDLANAVSFIGSLEKVLYKKKRGILHLKNDAGEVIEANCSMEMAEALGIGKRYSIKTCSGYLVYLRELKKM